MKPFTFKGKGIVAPKKLVRQKELHEMTEVELHYEAARLKVKLPENATKLEIIKALSEK